MNCYIYPSVIERHNSPLRQYTPNLIKGLKLHLNGDAYLLGRLALTEGQAPHKAMNSSPRDKDHQLLSRAGLIVAAQEVTNPIGLCVGFPFATYQQNREDAIQALTGSHGIKYEAGEEASRTATVEVSKVETLPEILGVNTFIRENLAPDMGNYFLVSLGYGTFETCLSTDRGVLERTLVSSRGLRYAIKLAGEALQEEYDLGMRTEHQLDEGFRKGSMVIERAEKDITSIRANVLRQYYREVISPGLKRSWKDDDFAETARLYLSGGGTNYRELVRCFEQEYGDVVEINVVPEPIQAAARGYYLHAKKSFGNEISPVGLDIGNAQSVVCYNGVEHV